MRPRRRANGEAGRGAAGAAGQWRRGAGPALGGEGAESQWGEGAGRRRAPRRPPAGRAAAVRAPSAPRPRRSPSPGRPRLLCGFAAHGLHRVSGDAPPHRPRGRYRDSPPPHPPPPLPRPLPGVAFFTPPPPAPPCAREGAGRDRARVPAASPGRVGTPAAGCWAGPGRPLPLAAGYRSLPPRGAGASPRRRGRSRPGRHAPAPGPTLRALLSRPVRAPRPARRPPAG